MVYTWCDIRGRVNTAYTIFEVIDRNLFEGVKHFVEKENINVNRYDSAGYTPLAKAIAIDGCKNINIIKYLIDQGTDVCKMRRNGKTPLALATEKKNIDLIRLLMDNGAKYCIQSNFLKAVKTKDLEIVSYFIENGANVNYCSPKDEKTPLDAAVETGNMAIVYLLLEKGAKFENLADTLLTKAVELENFKMVKILIERGVDPNRNDKESRNPLALAASLGAFSIARFLIESGADVELAKKEVEEFIEWNEDFALWMIARKRCANSSGTGNDVCKS